MKRIIFASLLFATAMKCIAQITPEQEQLYREKVERFSNMKSIGTTLTVGGSIASVVGIVILANAAGDIDADYYDDDYLNDFGRYTTGILVTAIGIDMVAGGIVLNSIGKRKMKQYQEKLNLGVIFNDKMKGLHLVYRF